MCNHLTYDQALTRLVSNGQCEFGAKGTLLTARKSQCAHIDNGATMITFTGTGYLFTHIRRNKFGHDADPVGIGRLLRQPVPVGMSPSTVAVLYPQPCPCGTTA